LQALQGHLMQLDQRISAMEEIMSATTLVVGQEQVSDMVKSRRVEKADARSAAEKAALDVALGEGKVVKTETIGEKSIVVGREKDKDGNDLPPGRVQLLFGQFLPEFQPQLLGKGVGTTVDTPIGGKFEVTEVYDIVDHSASEATESALTEELNGLPADDETEASQQTE
jgi:hypothetical protein